MSSRRHSGVVEVVQFWHTGCVVWRSWLAMVAMVASILFEAQSRGDLEITLAGWAKIDMGQEGLGTGGDESR